MSQDTTFASKIPIQLVPKAAFSYRKNRKSSNTQAVACPERKGGQVQLQGRWDSCCNREGGTGNCEHYLRMDFQYVYCLHPEAGDNDET